MQLYMNRAPVQIDCLTSCVFAVLRCLLRVDGCHCSVVTLSFNSFWVLVWLRSVCEYWQTGCEIRSDKQAQDLAGRYELQCAIQICLQLYDPVGDPGGTLWLLCLILVVCCMLGNDHAVNSNTCGRVGSHMRLLCKLLVWMFHVSVSCKLQVRLSRILQACRQPPAALLQVVGPVVSDFVGVRAATCGFIASCSFGCLGLRGCVGSHPGLFWKL